MISCLLHSSGLARERQHKNMACFQDPPEAVEITRQLLSSEAWEELSDYYDLSGTDIDRAQLVSGEFFIRRKRPELVHPAESWKFKEPFDPAFQYQSHRTMKDGVIQVTVKIEIDAGGGMVQHGLSTFPMRQSSQGYQLLPKSLYPGDPFPPPLSEGPPDSFPDWEPDPRGSS